MTFLRRPLIYSIIAIIAVITIIYSSGILNPEPLELLISSASPLNSSIYFGQNTTIAIIIDNKATRIQTYEFRIVYTSSNLTYYNGITKEPLLNVVYNGTNYSIIYLNDILGPNENAEIPIIVEGVLPSGISSKKYTIFFEVYSVHNYASKIISDRKSISLTVTKNITS
jgi:hypothetical protein